MHAVRRTTERTRAGAFGFTRQWPGQCLARQPLLLQMSALLVEAEELVVALRKRCRYCTPEQVTEVLRARKWEICLHDVRRVLKSVPHCMEPPPAARKTWELILPEEWWTESDIASVRNFAEQLPSVVTVLCYSVVEGDLVIRFTLRGLTKTGGALLKLAHLKVRVLSCACHDARALLRMP